MSFCIELTFYKQPSLSNDDSHIIYFNNVNDKYNPFCNANAYATNIDKSSYEGNNLIGELTSFMIEMDMTLDIYPFDIRYSDIQNKQIWKRLEKTVVSYLSPFLHNMFNNRNINDYEYHLLNHQNIMMIEQFNKSMFASIFIKDYDVTLYIQLCMYMSPFEYGGSFSCRLLSIYKKKQIINLYNEDLLYASER